MLSRNKRFRETHLGNPPKTVAMADSLARKRSLKLSLFVGLAESFASDTAASRSPRSFDDGAVGLGIVAAMSDAGAGNARPARPPVPARSEPIPIAPARPGVKPREAAERERGEEAELSESYTCVISHLGGSPVTKRVYFDDGSDGIGGNKGNQGVFFESPPPPPPPPPPPMAAKVSFPPASVVDFLSCCYLCQKKLHGLDIFMYRGDEAFCSAECRCQQILSDERREKCGSEESPCSASLFFASGVPAA